MYRVIIYHLYSNYTIQKITTNSKILLESCQLYYKVSDYKLHVLFKNVYLLYIHIKIILPYLGETFVRYDYFILTLESVQNLKLKVLWISKMI